jgi:hypothetical protein
MIAAQCGVFCHVWCLDAHAGEVQGRSKAVPGLLGVERP